MTLHESDRQPQISGTNEPLDESVEEPSTTEVAESEVAAIEEIPAPLSETTLPPEAQGEANGGPLGCCLGSVVGLLLTFLLMMIVSITIKNGGYLGPATLPIALLGAILCGFLGWKIGKAIYHEYELSPERKLRLEQVERQWRSRQKRGGRKAATRPR